MFVAAALANAAEISVPAGSVGARVSIQVAGMTEEEAAGRLVVVEGDDDVEAGTDAKTTDEPVTIGASCDATNAHRIAKRRARHFPNSLS